MAPAAWLPLALRAPLSQSAARQLAERESPWALGLLERSCSLALAVWLLSVELLLQWGEPLLLWVVQASLSE